MDASLPPIPQPLFAPPMGITAQMDGPSPQSRRRRPNVNLARPLDGDEENEMEAEADVDQSVPIGYHPEFNQLVYYRTQRAMQDLRHSILKGYYYSVSTYATLLLQVAACAYLLVVSVPAGSAVMFVLALFIAFCAVVSASLLWFMHLEGLMFALGLSCFSVIGATAQLVVWVVRYWGASGGLVWWLIVVGLVVVILISLGTIVSLANVINGKIHFCVCWNDLKRIRRRIVEEKMKEDDQLDEKNRSFTERASADVPSDRLSTVNSGTGPIIDATSRITQPRHKVRFGSQNKSQSLGIVSSSSIAGSSDHPIVSSASGMEAAMQMFISTPTSPPPPRSESDKKE